MDLRTALGLTVAAADMYGDTEGGDALVNAVAVVRGWMGATFATRKAIIDMESDPMRHVATAIREQTDRTEFPRSVRTATIIARRIASGLPEAAALEFLAACNVDPEYQ